MKIWQTIKIFWNEIQHVQLNLKSDAWRIKKWRKILLRRKIDKNLLRRAQEKTSLHYKEIFE